jgi:hypothetical protein
MTPVIPAPAGSGRLAGDQARIMAGGVPGADSLRARWLITLRDYLD